MKEQRHDSHPKERSSGRGDPEPENSSARAAFHDQSFLTYADPTGESAIRNLMAMTRSQELRVINERGDCIFFIKPHVLEEAYGLWKFTRLRNNKFNLRAHSKQKDPSRNGNSGGANESQKETNS